MLVDPGVFICASMSGMGRATQPPWLFSNNVLDPVAIVARWLPPWPLSPLWTCRGPLGTVAKTESRPGFSVRGTF